MDDKNQQPVPPNQPVVAQPVAPPTQPAISAIQPDKPALNISDTDAASILAINNLQAGEGPKKKLPKKLILTVGVLIALAILTSYLLGSAKSATSSSGSSLGVPSQSDPSTENGTANQVNQDVKSCANLVTAATAC